MNQDLVVQVKEIPEIQVAALRYKGKYEDVGIYLGQLFKVVGMHGSGVPFCLYYDEDYTEENADIEVAVPVKKELNKGDVSTRVLAAQKCVSLIHVGPYERLHESYKVIMDYIKENEMEAMTPSREIYMKGPGMLMKGNPEKYETEILIPVK